MTRTDRPADALRPVTIDVDVQEYAEGSVLIAASFARSDT